MQHMIFTVYDSKAEMYLVPFFERTDGQAIRGFQDACNDKGHAFYRHAEDFTLFELGEYEDTTAVFRMLNTPKPIGKAIEFKKDQNNGT